MWDKSKQEQYIVNSIFPKHDSWVIFTPIEQRIKEKIEKIGIPLKDWDIKINYGIKTGCNEAFIIDKSKRDELITESANSVDIIRPILRGKDIQRYSYNFANLYLINTHNGIKEKNIPPIDIDEYPAIKKHLDKYWNKISNREDQGKTPYNLRNCAYMDDFNKQKIIYPNMTKFLPFYLDNECFMVNQKCFILTGEKLFYLTAFLNSPIFKVCYKNNFPELKGGTRELSKIFFENISVLPVSDSIDAEFKKLVLLKQKQNFSDDPEKEINNLLYKLLGLEAYEIDFIEGTFLDS